MGVFKDRNSKRQDFNPRLSQNAKISLKNKLTKVLSLNGFFSNSLLTKLSPVSNPNLQWSWQYIQWGVLLLPIFPALGELCLLVALINIWQQKYQQIIIYPLNRLLVIFSLWLLITSCLAFDRMTALLGLWNFLPFLIIFATFSILINTPERLRRLAWILVFPSPFIVIVGIGQLFAGWSTSTIFGWNLVANGVPPGRMSSLFIYANFLAIYLTIVFILAIGLWIETYQLRGKKRVNWLLLFLTITLIIDAIGLVGTSSRNAWGLACFACLIFAFYLRWWTFLSGIIIAIGSISWASFGSNPQRDWLRQIIPSYFWARLSDEMYPDRPIATLRKNQWLFSWDLIQQRPLTGWGMRNFTPLYQAQTNEWLGHPHNFFLMLTAETGIPGLLLLSAVVGWIMFAAVRLLMRRSPTNSHQSSDSNYLNDRDQLIFLTYIIAFFSCIFFNLLDVTIYDLRVNTIVWIILAAICGVVYSNQQTKS